MGSEGLMSKPGPLLEAQFIQKGWTSFPGTLMSHVQPRSRKVLEWVPAVLSPCRVLWGLVWRSGGGGLLGRPAVLLVPTLPPLGTDLYVTLPPFSL